MAPPVLASIGPKNTVTDPRKRVYLDQVSASLKCVLASHVIDALQAHDHVLIAPGGDDALRDEMATIIASTLPRITPHLVPIQQITGEVTSTFGHDDADEAVEGLVQHITERLMESDHVDDIFAEDRLIRRDTFRAISDVLARYSRGEIDVTGGDETSGECAIALDGLGYVAATVAQTADDDILRGALECAAEAVSTTLVRLDVEARRAHFAIESSTADSRLAIEDAITEQLVDLVDQDVVELPNVEQVLQVDAETASCERFAHAVLRAVRRTQQETGCAVACSMVDHRTLLASLTPLTDEDARVANQHFESFLETLESSLSSLDAAQ
jgi:hypothetical protein